MAVTLLPFVEPASRRRCTRRAPTRTGLDWPSRPALGQLRRRLPRGATWARCCTSSVLIVLGVVPVSVLIATMAGFAHRPPADPRRPASLFLLFLLGLTLPFEGVITPLYYQIRDLGLLNTRLGDHPAADRAVTCRSRVFWMRAHFVNMPRRAVRGGAGRRRDDLAAVLAHPRAAGAAGDRVARRSCCSSGPGTSSCSRSCSSTTRRSGRWPARSARSRASGATDIPLLSAGSLLILTPTLDRLPGLPAPVRLGAAAGLAEGLKRT